jgi:hypothetical protein
MVPKAALNMKFCIVNITRRRCRELVADDFFAKIHLDRRGFVIKTPASR